MTQQRSGSRNAMFFRMLMRATMVKPGRVISALVAVVAAATVTTAMMNLYVDVQAKLRKEFRSYGANVVVVGRHNQNLPSDALTRVEGALGNRGRCPLHPHPGRPPAVEIVSHTHSHNTYSPITHATGD